MAPGRDPTHDTTAPPSSSASPLSATALPPEPLSPAETELTRVDIVLQAELIRGRLEAHGIPARLTDTHMAGLAPHLGAAIGGVRVIVGSADLETARAILDAPPIDDTDEEASDDDDVAAGPSMGPAETAARWALWSALLSIVVPVGGHVGSLFMIWRALAMAPPLGAPLSASGRRVVVAAVVVDIVTAATWALLLR